MLRRTFCFALVLGLLAGCQTSQKRVRLVRVVVDTSCVIVASDGAYRQVPASLCFSARPGDTVTAMWQTP